MTAQEIIYTKESELRLLPFEMAFAVDEAGNVVLEKAGEETEIAFTDEEIEQLHTASGVIFTHNHPGGWRFSPDDPRHGGNSFSPHDIHLACKTELAEIRAVTPRYRFSMRPSEDGWNETYWHTFLEPCFALAYEQVREELVNATLAGQITPQEYLARHYHETWVQVANLLGLRYTMREE